MKVALDPAGVTAVFRAMGSRGGKKTAARMSKKARIARARRAARARWAQRKGRGKKAR